MYEPLILEKKKPATLSGTLFAKVSAIIIYSKILAYCGSAFLVCNYMVKRKKFIAELNEVELTIAGCKIADEFQGTKEYWQNGVYDNIVLMVSETCSTAEKLIKNLFSTTSTDT